MAPVLRHGCRWRGPPPSGMAKSVALRVSNEVLCGARNHDENASSARPSRGPPCERAPRGAPPADPPLPPVEGGAAPAPTPWCKRRIWSSRGAAVCRSRPEPAPGRPAALPVRRRRAKTAPHSREQPCAQQQPHPSAPSFARRCLTAVSSRSPAPPRAARAPRSTAPRAPPPRRPRRSTAAPTSRSPPAARAPRPGTLAPT